jgi:hypothetical protein
MLIKNLVDIDGSNKNSKQGQGDIDCLSLY